MQQAQPSRARMALLWGIVIRSLLVVVLLTALASLLVYEFRPSLFAFSLANETVDPLAEYAEDPHWESIDADILRETTCGAITGALLALVYIGTVGWSQFGHIRAGMLGVSLLVGEWYVTLKMATGELDEYYTHSIARWTLLVAKVKETQWDQLAHMLWTCTPFVLGGAMGALLLTIGLGVFRTRLWNAPVNEVSI